MRFEEKDGALLAYHQGEMLRIESWGEDSLRVRATKLGGFTNEDWALTEPVPAGNAVVKIGEMDHRLSSGVVEKRPMAVITNGRIQAKVNFAGVITFYRDGTVFLQEYFRNYDGTISRESRCLKVINREWKGIIGGSESKLIVKFESNDGEKIFGMGQYQHSYMDLKGCTLELEQRNSQISVPFMISSYGYGMLWNNPAVGQVTFGKNYTEWNARSTRQMDYWLTVADTPKKILEQYTEVTGRAPGFPEDRMGLWQCKLRYRTQKEVLEVTRRYQKEGIHIDQIVIDFFHWTLQGDWKFDRKYWPDPKAMIDELHSMGIKVMVSVWPSVDKKSENFGPMMDRGLLIQTERGAVQTYDYQGDCMEIDALNPETRKYVWEVCKKNYYDLGVDGFWLDNSEPDFAVYDHENYRYFAGPALTCSNIYPQMYSRVFFDPMKKMGNDAVVNLLRCAWAGSQKYGNVVWSGDVPSTFEAFYDQLQAGLNMGLAGIPWWTTDIGGFSGGRPEDKQFQQLFVRWFEWGTFCPVMRLHGNRNRHGEKSNLKEPSGDPNELWSFGERIFEILKKLVFLRERLRPYIEHHMKIASEKGYPVMRPMFFDFPDDKECYTLGEQYMFGDDILFAPIVNRGQTKKTVYLPEGEWILTKDKKEYGKGYHTVTAEIDEFIAFVRKGAEIIECFA